MPFFSQFSSSATHGPQKQSLLFWMEKSLDLALRTEEAAGSIVPTIDRNRMRGRGMIHLSSLLTPFSFTPKSSTRNLHTESDCKVTTFSPPHFPFPSGFSQNCRIIPVSSTFFFQKVWFYQKIVKSQMVCYVH